MSSEKSALLDDRARSKRVWYSCALGAVRPYAEIIRFHKPIGTLNVYFPHLYGALVIASLNTQQPLEVLQTGFILLLICFISRSFACAWNDIVDVEFDKEVERCCTRPLARGALSIRNACMYVTAQVIILIVITGLLTGLTTLIYITPAIVMAFMYVTAQVIILIVITGLLTGLTTLIYITPAIVMAFMYPYMKRLTSYPQVFLGFNLAWGILTGACAAGAPIHKLWQLNNHKPMVSLLSLYVSYIIWTVIHDTVYAFQDIRDDKRIGLKSMAVRFENHPRVLLGALALLQSAALWQAGGSLQVPVVFLIPAFGGVSLLLIPMVWTIDPKDEKQCAKWFKYGSLAFGLLVAVGLSAHYGARLMDLGLC